MGHGTRELIRRAGLELGFCRIGFAALTPLPHSEFLRSWLAAGMAGGMAFLQRDPDSRAQPWRLLEGARTAIVAVVSYAASSARPTELDGLPGHGLIARYARGPDYHTVLAGRLQHLARRVRQLVPGSGGAELIAVDTLPLLERELAMAAGVGFIGKSTMLITPGIGSYTVLGTLLTQLELPPDEPSRPRCGRCELCLRACPTGALCEPYLVDSRRCIAQLTIEHRGPIEDELGAGLSPWVFGCDLCQQVCPHNARAGARAADAELSRDPVVSVDLRELLALRASGYRRLIRGRTLRRTPRWSLIRNAAIAAAPLVGKGDAALEQALRQAAESEDEGAQRAACWALQRAKT